MILTDYSSILHRCLHASISSVRKQLITDEGNDLSFYEEDGTYITKRFITQTKAFMFNELIESVTLYGKKYGQMVLCFDNTEVPYWRKDLYPAYKEPRKLIAEKSPINYNEVHAELKPLADMLMNFSPFVCVKVNRAEADDTILVLASRFGKDEPILILSPDKDFLQSQRTSELVDQYSPKTKKWLKPENKNDDMKEWLLEHVCLGDISDNVPKVVDFTVFSEAFKSWVEKLGLEPLEPLEFYEKYTKEKAFALMEKFDVYKKNRKGETLPEKDIFNNPALGAKGLHKRIEKFGGLDAWLDTHPLYREQYELNYILVMEEGIPKDIVENINTTFDNAPKIYDEEEVKKYLTDNKISQFIFDLPMAFGKGIKKEIDASFFNW